MNNVKRAREAKGISQKELAITLGVAQATVSNWETGRMNPANKHLRKIATLLSCTTDYLLCIPEAINTEDNPIKKEPSPRDELILLLEDIPDDKLDKFKAILLASIDAVK